MSLTAITFDSSAASMASRATADFIPFGVLARVTSPLATRRLETGFFGSDAVGEDGEAREVGFTLVAGVVFDAGDAFVLADEDKARELGFTLVVDADAESGLFLEESLGMIWAEGEK